MFEDFRGQFLLLAFFWILAGLLASVDFLGPSLGAAPKSVTQQGQTVIVTNTPQPTVNPTPTAQIGAPPPYVVVASPPKAGSSSTTSNNQGQTKPGSKASAATGEGILYQYTRLIPPQISQPYNQWHYFFYPLPFLLGYLLWRTISQQLQAQQRRIEQLAESCVWLEVRPPSRGQNIQWKNASELMTRLNGYMGTLPHNQPKNRRQGFGIHLTYLMISAVGQSIRFFICVPVPSKTNGTSKSKTKQQRELEVVPKIIKNELINITRTLYPWAFMEVVKTDPLDMEEYAKKHSIYRKYRLKIQEEGKNLVRGSQELALAHPSYLPLSTDFEQDPLNELFTRLNPSNTSELLSAAIVIVAQPVPAQILKQEVNRAAHRLHAEELGHSQKSKESLKPYSPKDGAGNPLNMFTGGGKAKGTTQAAKSNLASQSAKQSQTSIEIKGQECFAPVHTHIYLLVEGGEETAQERLNLLTNSFVNLYSSGGQIGRDRNTFAPVAPPTFLPVTVVAKNTSHTKQPQKVGK